MIIVNGKAYYSKLERIVSDVYCWGEDDEEPPQQPAPPPAPKLKTADELFNEAIAFAKQNTPLAYGARESALGDINKGNAYYEGYQPTSFEQALGNQYFQNVMPDIERSIKQNLSLSGMANSPILASQIATQRGNLGVSIGEYLSNLANTRATNSLTARGNIDPYSTYQNYLGTNLGQSNLQNNLNYQNALTANDIAYQNALSQYNYNQGKGTGMATGIGSVAGGIIGGTAGYFMGMPLQGASLGAGIGGGLGGMFEPKGTTTKAPVSMGDALAFTAMMNQGKAQPVYGTNSFDIQLRNLLQGKGMPSQIGSYSGYYNS